MDKKWSKIKKVMVVVEWEDGTTHNVLPDDDLESIEMKYDLKYDIKQSYYHGESPEIEHTGRISLNLNLSAWRKPEKK